jgi:hypothetical protein
MSMIKSGGNSAGPTPWPSKVLVFNADMGQYEGQPMPQAQACSVCGGALVKNQQGVLYCPACVEKEKEERK